MLFLCYFKLFFLTFVFKPTQRYNMETQLIILEQGNIIVSDQKIKEGDLYYRIKSPSAIITKTSKVEVELLNRKTTIVDARKVISSDNPEHNLPSIDYSILTNEECKTIGYSWSMEQFASYFVEKAYYITDNVGGGKSFNRIELKDEIIKIFCELGDKVHYLKNQSLNDKKIDLEFLDWIDKEEISRENGNWIKYFNGRDNHLTTKELYTYWLSKQKPKVFDIEVEMDSIPVDRSPTGWDTFPKIINNEIKITKIL